MKIKSWFLDLGGSIVKRVVFACLVFLVTVDLLAAEYLLKIPQNSDRQLQVLQEQYRFKLRFRTQNFALIQAEEISSAAKVLDQVTPDFNYYILETHGADRVFVDIRESKVLDRFNGFTLIKLHVAFESILFNLTSHCAKLPIEIQLPDRPVVFAPSLAVTPESYQKTVWSLLRQVDADSWFDKVKALVENEDLQHPGHFFRSRYALRVYDTKQYDDTTPPDYACDNAADWIASQFESYGLSVEFDSFQHTRSKIGRGVLGEYTMRNVVATLLGKGANSDEIYLVTGHYDSISSKTDKWEEDWKVLPAPGASDNASGVATMIEAARLLSQIDLNRSIRFVAFSGEELFLHGSRHYRQLVQARGDKIVGVINLDMVGHDGGGELDLHVLGDQQSQWLVQACQTVAKRYDIEVDLRLKNDPSFIFSDHSPFWEVAIPAIQIAEESSLTDPTESIEYIHSEFDVLDMITVPLGVVAHKLTVATMAELAGPDGEGFVFEPKPDSPIIRNLIVYPNPVNLQKSRFVVLDFYLTRPAEVQVTIHSSSAEHVFTSQPFTGKIGRNSDFDWQGKNMNGVRVASGVYSCLVTATDEDQNSHVVESKIVLIR